MPLNYRTRLFIACLACFYAFRPTIANGQSTIAPVRPNILWITSEDNGPELGCYGDEYATTPNIDALAARGMKYLNCWSNAPVCAPARTTIVTGMYPTSLGAQHMRSEVALPQGVKLYPQLFKELGYYTSNNSKEDYNCTKPEDTWDDSSRKAHWRNRQPGQPFFSVFNFTISHESKLRTRPHDQIHDPEKVTVPPYHPDTPEVRQDWAQYYDRLTEMDAQVGDILEQLEEDGLEDNTIVFYYGDHGSGMPRGKRWLYQSGLLVPLIVHVPEKLRSLAGGRYEAGTDSTRLVSFVDLAPTVLSLASQRPPATMQGKAFLGAYATEDPSYIYGFRDRMDERYDMSRAVRNDKYLYIRNFYPQRPQGTFLDYMFQTPTTRVWKQLFDDGKLTEAQSFFWKEKPAEELYDLTADPYQINNLAGSGEHSTALEELRSALKAWMIDVKDTGFMPEGEMLAKCGERSPYDFARKNNYPVERYFDIAATATQPDAPANTLQSLLEHKADADSIVRYWVASGLLVHSLTGTVPETALPALRGLSTDTSAYVRCIANETLARFGPEADRNSSMNALLRMADPRESSMFVAITAMNSLDWCQPTNGEIASKLDGFPAKDANVSGRYGTYIERLVERLHSIAE